MGEEPLYRENWTSVIEQCYNSTYYMRDRYPNFTVTILLDANEQIIGSIDHDQLTEPYRFLIPKHSNARHNFEQTAEQLMNKGINHIRSLKSPLWKTLNKV